MQNYSWRINSRSTRRLSRFEVIFSLSILDQRPGYLMFSAEGNDAAKLFGPEAGGHRWQRIPPTEKKGRVQTSTVTVAVLSEPKGNKVRLDARDLEERVTRGSGAGGQHKNVTSSAVVLTHKPTGLRVRIESERDQHRNRAVAKEVLLARLAERAVSAAASARNSKRRAQVGSGMRGDKIRTVRVRDNRVTDHRTRKKMTYARYRKGHFADLH